VQRIRDGDGSDIGVKVRGVELMVAAVVVGLQRKREKRICC
jgi:hypothetical protein